MTPTDPEAYDWMVDEGEHIAEQIASQRDPFGWLADRAADRDERRFER